MSHSSEVLGAQLGSEGSGRRLLPDQRQLKFERTGGHPPHARDLVKGPVAETDRRLVKGLVVNQRGLSSHHGDGLIEHVRRLLQPLAIGGVGRRVLKGLNLLLDPDNTPASASAPVTRFRSTASSPMTAWLRILFFCGYLMYLISRRSLRTWFRRSDGAAFSPRAGGSAARAGTTRSATAMGGGGGSVPFRVSRLPRGWDGVELDRLSSIAWSNRSPTRRRVRTVGHSPGRLGMPHDGLWLSGRRWRVVRAFRLRGRRHYRGWYRCGLPVCCGEFRGLAVKIPGGPGGEPGEHENPHRHGRPQPPGFSWPESAA